MVRLLRFVRFNSSIVLIVILIITRRSIFFCLNPSVNKNLNLVNLGVQGEVIRELFLSFLIIYDCCNPPLVKL
jgi:hypothetical protein